MFNLLMFNVEWASCNVSVPIERMFEYTDDHVAAQFRDGGNNPMLDCLTDLPCIFCWEGTEDQTAYVGQINKARITGRNLSLEISFDIGVPLLDNRMLYTSRTDLDMPHKSEFSRHHWAVKDVDLYRFLLQNIHPLRQRPTVFRISDRENINQSLVSAMMPFDAAFNTVYDSIREAVNNAGLQCMRADDIWENPEIIQDVVLLIDRSRIVICDCTGKNPNVFYEVGIAHTLGRDVILITQSEHDIPFDIRHLRFVKYLNNAEGRISLAQELQSRIETLLNH